MPPCANSGSGSSTHRSVERPRDAAAGTSFVIIGGDAKDIETAKPICDCIGDKTVHAGPNGAGIRLKLVNNYMSTVGTLLVAEALTLANKSGWTAQ